MPPWTDRSACSSPSTLRRRTATRLATGDLKNDVLTGRPFERTSRGRPTLREIRFMRPRLAQTTEAQTHREHRMDSDPLCLCPSVVRVTTAATRAIRLEP